MNKEKTSFIYNNIFALKYVFKFCKSYIFASLVYIASEAIAALGRVIFISDITRYVINHIDNVENNLTIYSIVIKYGIILIVTTLISAVYVQYLSIKYRAIYRKKMQNHIFTKVKTIDIELYDNPKFYDSFSRTLNEASFRGLYTYTNLVSFLSFVINAIALGAYVIISDRIIILIVLLSTIIPIIMSIKSNKKAYLVRIRTEKDRRYYYYVNRTFYQKHFAEELKVSNVGEVLIDRYYETSDNIEKEFKEMYKKTSIYESISEFAKDILRQAGSYIYLGYRLLKGMSIATFTTSINAITQLYTNIMNASSAYIYLKESALYISDMLWLFNYKPNVETNKGKSFSEKFEKLQIKDLTFTYPSSPTKVLDNVNMEIKKGQKIAIVGQNGSGKTTLIKLLLKFYLTEENNIYINDQKYNDFNQQTIRKNYATVFQNFQIYALSIIENILLRKPTSPDDEKRVWDALEMVGMREEVSKLEKNIYTELTKEFTSEGKIFSGGQLQRLIIARVFASDAQVYILDEPTSALDPLSEEKINKLIINNSNKTMIIIAHRLSTIVDCDKIYLLHEGKIVEEGTHKQLLALGKEYAQMFNTQKSMYEKENIND